MASSATKQSMTPRYSYVCHTQKFTRQKIIAKIITMGMSQQARAYNWLSIIDKVKNRHNHRASIPLSLCHRKIIFLKSPKHALKLKCFTCVPKVVQLVQQYRYRTIGITTVPPRWLPHLIKKYKNKLKF
jgi:hypothetical protein